MVLIVGIFERGDARDDKMVKISRNEIYNYLEVCSVSRESSVSGADSQRTLKQIELLLQSRRYIP